MRKPLPGIDNGRQQQYTIRMFSLLWQHVKCAAKYFDGELYVAKEKIQNYIKALSNGYKTWWPIYTPHPGHLKIAGVPRHLIHIQEHLQAIQELIDHILSF